jgi:hypothetical protein
MRQDQRPETRYVGMCIGEENIWVSCPGVPLPERQPTKPSSVLRLIKRLKKRPERFHIVAEPSRDFDLTELMVWEKFHAAEIPVTFVDRSWLYEFRENLPDGDRYYIDADLLERYGREKRPHENPLPSPEIQMLAHIARTAYLAEQHEQILAALRDGPSGLDKSDLATNESDPGLERLQSSLREGLREISGLYETIQRYCARTGQGEALATLVFVILPDSFQAELGAPRERAGR